MAGWQACPAAPSADEPHSRNGIRVRYIHPGCGVWREVWRDVARRVGVAPSSRPVESRRFGEVLQAGGTWPRRFFGPGSVADDAQRRVGLHHHRLHRRQVAVPCAPHRRLDLLGGDPLGLQRLVLKLAVVEQQPRPGPHRPRHHLPLGGRLESAGPRPAGVGRRGRVALAGRGPVESPRGVRGTYSKAGSRAIRVRRSPAAGLGSRKRDRVRSGSGRSPGVGGAGTTICKALPLRGSPAAPGPGSHAIRLSRPLRGPLPVGA